MKLCILVVMLAAVVAEEESDETIDTRVNDMLENKSRLVSYLKCAIGENKCTRGGKWLKGIIIEVLQHGCNSCSERQRSNVNKVIWHIFHYEPIWWEKLVYKYDPHLMGTKYEMDRKNDENVHNDQNDDTTMANTRLTYMT